MRLRFFFLLTPLGVWLACGGETVIATNNQLPDEEDAAAGQGGVAGGGASATGGSETGGSASAECTPGEEQVLGTCEKCGTAVRTCDASGHFGEPACEEQGECSPGDEIAGGCPDPCEVETCGVDCKPDDQCKLRAGAACKWNEGKVPQCCGTNAWQFCSKTTCQWFPCDQCDSTSTWCLGLC